MEPTADITPPSPHHDPLIPDDGQGLLPILLGNPDYIPAEVSLETIGYFTPSSKRIKHILTKEKILTEKLGSDGVKVALKVAIIASGKYGLPNTSDLDYHRGFLKFLDELVEEAGDIPEPLRLPAKPIIRYAGKTIRGGKAATRLTHSKKTGKPITVTHNPTIEEFKDWIRRGHHTGITGYLYDAATGDYVEVGDEPLFRKYRLRGQLMENGQLAETNYVWLASWFRANYHRYRRTIDFALHRRLQTHCQVALSPPGDRVVRLQGAALSQVLSGSVQGVPAHPMPLPGRYEKAARPCPPRASGPALPPSLGVPPGGRPIQFRDHVVSGSKVW